MSTPTPPESQAGANRFSTLHRFARVDSTNAEALRALAAGTGADGHVWIALEQTAGRGRRGRAWWSAPGEGLTLSALWLPTRPMQAPWVTMTAGVAVWRTLKGLGVQDAALKWPNDVVHPQGKLAGILVESRSLDTPAQPFVLGIGINRAQERFPAELLEERSVTSLALLGAETPATTLEEALLAALSSACHEAETNPQAICDAYWSASPWTQADLALEGPGPREVGRALDLHQDHGLRWQPHGGSERWVRLEFIRDLRPVNPSSP